MTTTRLDYSLEDLNRQISLDTVDPEADPDPQLIEELCRWCKLSKELHIQINNFEQKPGVFELNSWGEKVVSIQLKEVIYICPTSVYMPLEKV